MRLWKFFIVLFIATFMGVLISRDPGYALFGYGNWTIEMPLWMSILAIILLVIASLIFLWLMNTLFSSSGKIQDWWNKHKLHNARLLTYQGLLALTEGRWKQAERYLSKGARLSDSPLINYLSAAKAAEELGSPERRDNYLQLAFEASGNSDVAVRLTQAKLQMKHGELERSIANLERLHAESPNQPKVLRLLCTLYEAMNDYQSLFLLLPELHKTRAFSKEVLEGLERKSYHYLLAYHAKNGLSDLQNFWKQAPRSVQRDHTLIANYAHLLLQQNAHDEAEAILREALKKEVHDDLLLLYGLTKSQKPKKQLELVEALLSTHFDNAILLLTFGRLCLNNQLWNKAREYLEQSLAVKPSAEAYAELGQLMEQLGFKEKSEEYYKKGLLTVTPTLNTLSSIRYLTNSSN